MMKSEMCGRQIGWAGMMLLSCGARSELPYEDPGVNPQSGEARQASPAAPPAARQERSGERLFRSGALLDCEPGAPPDQASDCSFLADGLCYATMDEACACVCPRSHNSRCIAGLFENEFGAVDLSCD